MTYRHHRDILLTHIHDMFGWCTPTQARWCKRSFGPVTAPEPITYCLGGNETPQRNPDIGPEVGVQDRSETDHAAMGNMMWGGAQPQNPSAGKEGMRFNRTIHWKPRQLHHGFLCKLILWSTWQQGMSSHWKHREFTLPFPRNKSLYKYSAPP